MHDFNSLRNMAMIMTLILLLCAIVFHVLTGGGGVRGEFLKLKLERQEQYCYDELDLPKTVQRLIYAQHPMKDMIEIYDDAKDEVNKFNVMIVIKGVMSHHSTEASEKAAGMDFLKRESTSPCPWLRGEAIEGLALNQYEGTQGLLKSALMDASYTVRTTAAAHILLLYGAELEARGFDAQEMEGFATELKKSPEEINRTAMAELVAYRNGREIVPAQDNRAANRVIGRFFFYEVIALIVLTGVFWHYGGEMHAGPWVMVITFLGTWLVLVVFLMAIAMPIPFVAVVGSLIATSAFGIYRSIAYDAKRKKMILDEQRRTTSPGSPFGDVSGVDLQTNCTRCGALSSPGTRRCGSCGASLVRR